jgi:hypothetical protein
MLAWTEAKKYVQGQGLGVFWGLGLWCSLSQCCRVHKMRKCVRPQVPTPAMKQYHIIVIPRASLWTQPQMQFSRCISLWTFLPHPAQTPKCDFYYLATYNSLKAKKILQTSWLTFWSQFSLSNFYIHQSILALELNRVYTLEHSGKYLLSIHFKPLLQRP